MSHRVVEIHEGENLSDATNQEYIALQHWCECTEHMRAVAHAKEDGQEEHDDDGQGYRLYARETKFHFDIA